MMDDEEREALEMTAEELLDLFEKGRHAKLWRGVHIYVDRMDIGNGVVSNFTWGEARAPCPLWQRALRWLVPKWRKDVVLRRYTNAADLPIWVRLPPAGGVS